MLPPMTVKTYGCLECSLIAGVERITGSLGRALRSYTCREVQPPIRMRGSLSSSYFLCFVRKTPYTIRQRIPAAITASGSQMFCVSPVCGMVGTAVAAGFFVHCA